MPCSLADLDEFIQTTERGLSRKVEKGDYGGLVEVMGHLLAVKERHSATDAMFEPLKETIELLRAYEQQLPEEVHQQLEVGEGSWWAQQFAQEQEVKAAGVEEHPRYSKPCSLSLEGLIGQRFAIAGCALVALNVEIFSFKAEIKPFVMCEKHGIACSNSQRLLLKKKKLMHFQIHLLIKLNYNYF